MDIDFDCEYDHDPFERHDDYNVFEENCLANDREAEDCLDEFDFDEDFEREEVN